MTSGEKKRLKLFEKKLGFTFKNPELLRRALTHKSYANEMKLSPFHQNERLEFLGDAVLELAVSHLLMQAFEEHPEGELSKLRAAIVNEEKLAALARRFHLGEFLILGKGEEATGGRDKPSLLSNALEAVLGAVYLDGGFKKAYPVIEKHYAGLIEEVGKVGFFQDYKTRLQEISQGRFRTTPRYKLVKAVGPDHSKTFEVHLFIHDDLFGVGEGLSKKSAEQSAAKKALEKLESAG